LLLKAGIDDIHAAAVNSAHLQHAKKLLKNHSNFIYRAVFVEKSNFQPVLRTLDAINNQSGITFVSLHVVGTLSAVDLASLIERTKYGSIRLLLLFYPQLLYSLQLTDTIRSVIVPDSLNSVSHIKTALYDNSTVAGAITLAQSSLYKKNPIGFYDYGELRRIKRRMRRQQKWNETESEWRESQLSFSEEIKETLDQMYAMLICEDPEYVEHYYLQPEHKDKIRVLNARDPAEIHAFMEKGSNVVSQAFVNVSKSQLSKKTADAGDFVEIGKISIVVINSQLLSNSQRCSLATYAISRGFRFMVVASAYNPEDRRLTIRSPRSNQPIVIEVRSALFFDLMLLKSHLVLVKKKKKGTLIRCIPDFRVPKRDEAEMAQLRILNLIFGPVIKFKMVSSSKIFTEPIETMNKSKTGFHPRVLQSVLKFIFQPKTASKEDSEQEQEEEEEENPLGAFIVNACRQYIEREHDYSNDISFYYFSQHCKVMQWLSQDLRIEHWLRMVLRVSEDDPTLAVRSHCGKNQGLNVHSPHLIQFMEEKRDSESLKNADDPSYSFVEKDRSIVPRELLLQQSIQCNELNWGDLSRVIFPFSLEFLMSLLSTYHQPVKLLSILPKNVIFDFFVTVKKNRFPLVVSRLKKEVSSKIWQPVRNATSFRKKKKKEKKRYFKSNF
jgi:hypothetical protein